MVEVPLPFVFYIRDDKEVTRVSDFYGFDTLFLRRQRKTGCLAAIMLAEVGQQPAEKEVYMPKG